MGGQAAGAGIGSIVGGVIGNYFFPYGGGYAGAMIGGALGGYVGRMLDPIDAPKPPPLGDITLNTYNRNSPLGVCYGQCKVGGGVIMRDQGNIDIDREGSKDAPTFEIKMTVVFAVAHCEGPILGLASPERFWIDDKAVSRGSNSGGAWDFIEYFGTEDQIVDAYFLGYYANQVPPPPLKLTCWTRVFMHVEGSTVSMIPNFSIELRGFLTEEGEFDANPIRVAYDWLTNVRYAVGLPPEMLNGTPDTIGSPWKEASDYCDELVDYTDRNGDTVQEPRFRYSNFIDEVTKGYDFISDLMGSCRGILRYKNGMLEPLIEHGFSVPEYYYSDRKKVDFVVGVNTTIDRIYANFSAYPEIFWRGSTGIIIINEETVEFAIKDQTSTYIDLCISLSGVPDSGISFTLTKDNIKEGSFSFKQIGDNEIPNLLRVEYQRRQVFNIDEQKFTNEYLWSSIEHEVPELYIYKDYYGQNLKKIKTVRYSGIKRATQAMRMGQFLGDTIYFSRWLCSFTTGIEGYQHGVGDIVGVTHIQAGWEDKWFRIMKMDEQEGDQIALDLIEYNPNVYNDEIDVSMYDPNYSDHGGSSWTMPPQIERFVVAQDLSTPNVYKVYLFFKRPENSNFWYGAKIFASGLYINRFSVTSPSVKLSSDITSIVTTIPFDPLTLYGSFPVSGSFFIDNEFITYSGISGNSFTGCVRINGANHSSSRFCNLVQSSTPFILFDSTYVGNEILFQAVSYVQSGVSADISFAPSYNVFLLSV